MKQAGPLKVVKIEFTLSRDFAFLFENEQRLLFLKILKES